MSIDTSVRSQVAADVESATTAGSVEIIAESRPAAQAETTALPDTDAYVVMRPDIRLAGHVDVSSDTLGGEVTLRGNSIQLEADSSIDARGGTGGGQVSLEATQAQAGGRINVSSASGRGGRIQVEGDDIELKSTAEADATGATASTGWPPAIRPIISASSSVPG